MPQNTPIPLIDRLNLEAEFAGTTPETTPEDIQNIPFKGLDNPSPSLSLTGDSKPITLEESILSMGSGDGKLTGGGINRSLAEVSSDRFKNFVPGEYNNEDAYAQGQGWASKMVNGVSKGLLLTGTTFLQSTVGLVNGVAKAASDGRLASFYDNDFNRALDELNKKAENALPNYYTDAEKNARWYSPSKIFSANFLWDGIVKNLGFAAGAALSGGVYAAGIKGLAALPGLSRLVSVGKGAEALAATEEALAAANVAGRSAETLGKVKSLSDKFLSSYNVLTPGGRAVVAGLSTTGEAGFEAFQNLNQFRDEKIKEYQDTHNGAYPMGEDLEKINSAADSVGNSSMFANMALLTATNYIQFPKILGSSYTAEKGILNNVTREIGDIVEEGGKYVAKKSGNRILSTLNKIRPYTFSSSEAFEEGAQFAIQIGTQDYYDKKYDNTPTDFLSSLSQGIKQTLTTDEGMENVLIGGLSGAIMLGKGRFQEQREIKKNTAQAIQEFNRYKLSNFTKDTIDAVNRGTLLQEQREGAIKSGNILESKDLEQDYIINYLTPRIKYGRFDLVKSDIDDYKRLASTQEGFAQLMAEGKVSEGDTREAYLKRLSSLEQTAENIKSLYQSLNVRYGGAVDEKGNRIYSDSVLDKMVYAATKVADYDNRIQSLNNELTGISDLDIDLLTIVNDLSAGKIESFNEAVAKIEASDKINKDELGEKLNDLGELTLRRKLLLNEYSEIKKNPKKYHEQRVEDLPTEGPEVVKPTITIKTKNVSDEFEVGTEYYLGKVVEHDEKGHEVYRFPRLTILGENEDGTIKIKTSNGRVRDISKEELADYKLGRVDSLDKNKKAKFFMENANTIFEFNFGKGKKQKGRLEYSPKEGVLNFVYRDNKGKIKKIEVTGDQFIARKGFNMPMIRSVGELTAVQEKTLQDYAAEQDDRIAAKKEARLKILNDLFEELFTKEESIKKLISRKQTEIKNISDELSELEKTIAQGEVDKRIKKAFNFKASVRTALNNAMSLSRAKEQLEREIEDLTAQQTDLDFTMSYVSDVAQNIDELPTDSQDFMDEIKDQLDILKDLSVRTAKEISAMTRLVDQLSAAIDSAINIINDLIGEFVSKYPKAPLATIGQEWIDFLKNNPNFLKLKPEYKNDLTTLETLIAETEDFEIKPNQDKIEELNSKINELSSTMKDLDKEVMALDAIYSRFESIANEYKRQKEEEQLLQKNSKLIKEALGTVDNETSHTTNSDRFYEAVKKKATDILWRATMGVIRGKAHQERANRFGARLNSLISPIKDEDSVRGLIVTSKNQDQIIPGLMDMLVGDNTDINKDDIIAMVMVKMIDGKPVLIDEFGNTITNESEKLDKVITQVFPLADLKWGKEFGDESMFRENTPQEVKDYVLAEYAKQRKQMLENSNDLTNIHEVKASFGIPAYDYQLDEKGDPIKGNNNKPLIDYSKRTSASKAGLINDDSLEAEQLIFIPKTNENVNKGTTSFVSPLGRPFLELPDAVVPLQNRHHTAKEAETIYQAILQLSKNMMNKEIGLKHPETKRLLHFLKSVVYWKVPEGEHPAGYNNIFWEVDAAGNFKLNISGKGQTFPFTPSGIEENKAEITLLLQNMYNNVNSLMAQKLNEPYEEILSISSDGTIRSRIWKNYQSYLLADKFIANNESDPTNGQAREDIPLATMMREVTETNDTNRTGIYFYTTDNVDDVVIQETSSKKFPIKIKPTITKSTKSEEKTFALKSGRKLVFTINGDKINIIEDKGDYQEILEKGIEKFVAENEEDSDTFTIGEDEENLKKYKPQVDELLINTIKKAMGDQVTQQEETEEEETEEETGDDTFTIGEDDEADDDTFVFGEESEDGESATDAVNRAIRNALQSGPAPDDLLRQVVLDQTKDYTIENWSEVETWLKKNFPNLPVYRVKNIIQATHGRQAWGMFKDGAIYVYENAEVGTTYHEVFEAIWKMFASSEERESILKEFSERKGTFVDRPTGKTVKYSEATPIQIKEQLAEEFRDYVQFKKIPAKPESGRPFVLKLFSDLVSFIREMFYGRNAQSKVEQMFKNINEGAYSTHIPYESQLSLVNKGIIDIDDAVASNDSEFRIKGMSDIERSEIIQHMTYLTLIDLIKNDSSLFNMAYPNKGELYTKLKDQVLETIAKKLAAINYLIDNKEITKKQAEPQIKAVKNLMVAVASQWNSIVDKHREYLKSYSIEFDENDELQIISDEKRKDETLTDANKIDHFKKANAAVKMLLSTIPVVNPNDTTKPLLSSIGGVTLLPVSKTYVTLMNNLHNSRSVEEMLEKLHQLAKQDPNYRTLYKRITKNDWMDEGIDLTKINNEHSARIVTSIWRTFKKQNPEVKNVYILENGEVVIGDANLSSAAAQLRDDYINNIVAKAKEDVSKSYFTYDAKKKVYSGDPTKIKNVNLDSIKAMVSFLNKLGIPFDIKDANRLKGRDLSIFKEAVSGIKESISKGNSIATFSSKALDIHGRLLEIGYIQSKLSNPDFDSTFFNINNERTQSFIGTNPASDLYEFLSQIESLDESVLAGTQYAYLGKNGDVFASGSNLLKRMFNSKGTRKKDKESEGLLRVAYIGGTDNQQKGKQRQSSKLSYKERMVQEINLNLAGYYLNLVPGDASMEWAVFMGNPISTESLSRGMTDVNMIFRNYFISELKLARENRKVAKERNAKSLRFFESILGEKLSNEILLSNKPVEKVYNDFEIRINSALLKHISLQNKQLLKNLENYEVVNLDETGISFQNINLPRNLNEAELNNHLTALTVNYMIANIELHKLLYADPFQYSDELKRIKNFNSPRQALVNNSPKMNAVLNKVWNKTFKKGTIGWTDFTTDRFRSVTLGDVTGIIDLPGYKDYTETDGGGIITLKAYRQFKIRIGEWNDKEEAQYQHDMSYEQMAVSGATDEELAEFDKNNPAVKSAYTPLKPIVSGNKNDSKKYNDIILDKFALYPISYRLLRDLNAAGMKENSNMILLYEKMRDENIDYAVFESGRKVGATPIHSIYNTDGTFNTAKFKNENIINVPFAIMSVQAEVPSKESHQVTRGSQITKLVTLDFMEAGVPVDFQSETKDFTSRYKAWYKLSEEEKTQISPLYKEIKRNQELLEAMMDVGYQKLLSRLGIAETEKGYEIIDFSQTANTLREEILKREVNDNIIDAITAFENGKTILEATPAYQQLRNILYSIADKQVITPKVNGGMKVQVPSTLLESVRAEEKEINGKTGYVSDVLGFYKKDGKQVCEIMIGRWFDSNMSDSELLDYLNNTEEGQKVLSGLGFRIPTQKQNSIDSFVIKQFLPKEFGDSVIIPAALVAKAGSDFDIDKLTIYLKNVKVRKGKPELVAFKDDSNSTVRERYNSWVKNIGNVTIQNYVRLLSRDQVSEIKNRFKEKFDELNDRYKISLNNIKEEQYSNLLARYRAINDDIKTEQNNEMAMLFNVGSKIFAELPLNYKDVFYQIKGFIQDNNVSGPKEIELYLAMATRILDEYEVPLEIETRLKDMISIYEQELRILGSTEESIKQLKDDALEEFRNTKSNEITDLQLENLLNTRDLAKEQSLEVSEFENDIIDEIAKISKLASFEEFSKKSVMAQNSKEALENEYIDSSQKLVSHPLNFNRLIKPNSADQMKDLSKKIVSVTVGSTFGYKNVGNMLNREFMSRLRHAFVSGKQAIGIAAVNQTNHSLNQRQPIYIDSTRLENVSSEDRYWLGKDASVNFEKFNRIEIDGRMVPTLSMIKNANGQDISDIIAQFIDGYVDISKGPWIMELGATPNVAATWLFLVKLGVPIDTVAYFMNQPIIREYLRTIESAGYTWLFMDKYVENVKENYKPTYPMVAPTKIPSENELWETVGKTAENMSNDERVTQQMMLDEFLKYAKMAEHLFHITQGSNFDTASFNDPYLVFKKFKQLEKASNTIISDVNSIMSNSFIGALGINIQKVRNALAEILTSDRTRVRDIVENVLTPYINLSDDDFIKLSRKAVNDLFDYAVQTDQGLNNYIKDILIEDGGVSQEVLDFVNVVKNNPNHPLHNNYIIDIIQVVPSKKAENTGVNNIKVRGLGNKIYDQNNIIYAFRELRDRLKGKSDLYNRLLKLAILQNGLSSSVLSFTSVLPFEDFEKIYNKTLSKLESLPNLRNFVKLNVFQRNNWNNDDIVPHQAAVLITSKKSGDKFYNPPMEFLDKKVKKAIKEGKIPQVMTVRALSREATKDHLVYTWEKRKELITPDWKKKYPKPNNISDYQYEWWLIKQIKADMRKSGDYSYINKGLFEKVRNNFGTPLMTFYTSSEGERVDQYIYKAINAWGDGYRANEFYDVDKPSVIDNGFIKAKGVDNNVIIDLFLEKPSQNTNTKTTSKISESNENGEDDGIPRTEKERIELAGYISGLQLLNDGNMELTVSNWLEALSRNNEDFNKDLFNKMIDSLLLSTFVKRDAGGVLQYVRDIGNEWFAKNRPDDKTNNWEQEDNNCPIPF